MENHVINLDGAYKYDITIERQDKPTYADLPFADRIFMHLGELFLALMIAAVIMFMTGAIRFVPANQ